MRRLSLALTLLALAASALADDGPPPAETLPAGVIEAVTAAVDADDEQQREALVTGIAKRPGVTVDALLPVLAAFGTFEPVEAGTRQETVTLRVAGKDERTRIDVHVPAAYDPDVPAALMMAFHGAGGEGAHEISRWRGLADELGMLVIAPTEAGENGGYRFSPRERDAAWAALRWARRRFNVDENRTYASGVSRGGHMTWDLALRRPDVFAALSPAVGGPRLTPRDGQNNLRYLRNVAHVPIRDLQGSRDDPRLLKSLRWAFEKLEGYGAADARLIEFPELGHSFEMGAVDWRAFLGGAVRDPRAERVVRCAAREDEARCHWVEITRFTRDVGESVVLRVDPAKWNALDEDGRRAAVAAAAEDRTALLEIRRTAPGRFEAKSRGVAKFRLLLDRDAIPEGARLEVVWNGRTIRRTVRASARVLLTDFVARFDRTYLPVAEVTIP